jgi:cysteine desulfurase/selenocysteine lyase
MQVLHDVDLVIKEQFTLLKGSKILYLDTAATSLKPEMVIEAECEFYRRHYATVHRSLYPRAQEATKDLYLTRELIAKRIGAPSVRGIIFTRGATDSLNQVAQFLMQIIEGGGEILISPLEHHANLLPFKALEKKGLLKIRDLPVHPSGAVNFEALFEMDLSHVRALTIAHVSNVTGVTQDLKQLGAICRTKNWVFIVDGAQGLAHKKLDVLGCEIDFLAFSAHKMYGPTGVGALYIADRFVDLLEPINYGGDMILELDKDMHFQEPPLKFEAGTPAIAQIIGWKEALNFQSSAIFEKKVETLGYIASAYREGLKAINGVEILSAPDSDSIITFVVSGVHSMDLALLLGENGVEVRSGSLCALNALKFFEVNSFLRISLGIYNTLDEVDSFFNKLKKVLQFF